MKARSATILAVVIISAIISIPFSGFAEEAAPPAAGGGAYPDGLVYTVIEGDTLWDLSSKYLGSPWKWPELWERNRFLTNPHYIYPGIRIVIFPPPGKEIALELAGEEPGAAAPKEAGKPDKDVPVAAKAQTLAISPSDYVRAGEFVREAPAGIGRIRGGEEPKVAFSDGDTVFLKLDKEIPAGQLLGVYRVRGPISTPGDRRSSGYSIYLVGLIQATGKRNGEATGIVRKSFEDLGREDLLREEIPSYAPVVLSRGRGEGLAATIISGQWENEEMAAGNFLFLDRGKADGVAVGDVFRLYNVGDKSPAGDSADMKDVPVEVGEGIIVRASADYSTAYVAKSRQSFSTGGKAIRGSKE